MGRTLVRCSGALAIALGLSGCGAAGDDPQTVAERFWTAVQEKDRETVDALSIPSEGVDLNFDREDTPITRVEIGESRTEGDLAFVQTRVQAPLGDEVRELEFETTLARPDGDWLVDLDPTSDALVAAVLGVSMQELGQALGEGMREAMQDVAEGMAEGMSDAMRAMAEGMSDTMREVADSLERPEDDGSRVP